MGDKPEAPGCNTQDIILIIMCFTSLNSNPTTITCKTEIKRSISRGSEEENLTFVFKKIITGRLPYIVKNRNSGPYDM